MEIGKLGAFCFMDAMPAPESAAFCRRVERMGYKVIWSPEAWGREPFAHVNKGAHDVNTHHDDVIRQLSQSSDLLRLKVTARVNDPRLGSRQAVARIANDTWSSHRLH